MRAGEKVLKTAVRKNQRKLPAIPDLIAALHYRPPVTRAEKIMAKAFIRARIISAARTWYAAGCPDCNADGDGPNGELQDAISALIDHEEQSDMAAEERRMFACYEKRLGP